MSIMYLLYTNPSPSTTLVHHFLILAAMYQIPMYLHHYYYIETVYNVCNYRNLWISY